MKKILSFLIALALIGGSAFADLQIDQGKQRGQDGAVGKFFVARNGRVAGISADRVVVWDTTSNDGVSVTTTTLSNDALAAGVTIDALPGITSDATAANSPGGTNWGRVRVYGRHDNVSFDQGATGCSAGSKVGTHSIAGTATVFRTISNDSLTSTAEASRDNFGVALEACATGNTTIDVFVQRG